MNFNIKKKKIERIIITGDMAYRNEALKYCEDRGYNTTRVGPKRKADLTVDCTKFKIVAEREVK